jgi:multiple sugar transport system ATP-binding protein
MTLGRRVAVMRHGVLQQVATPQQLYSRPANLFVAGFIGSPAMNLLDARIEPGDLGPEVVVGRHRLPVTAAVQDAHPQLHRFGGQEVVLGIRPESLHDADLTRDADPAALLELPVELREELGSEVHVHAATGGGARLAADVSAETTGEPAGGVVEVARATLIARLDPRTAIQAGGPARLHVDLAALHFFDPATGESLRG